MAKAPKPDPDKKGAASGTSGFLQLRPQLIVTALLLLGVGGVARLGWEHVQTSLAFSGRYQVTAETIHVLPDGTPPWIRSDVKGEILRNADLEQTASLLDDPLKLQQRLVGAFELHPWVKLVEKVEFVGPKRIDVHVRYREPVAVVTVAGDVARRELFLVDLEAFRLPDADLTEVEKSYLPRVVDIVGRPPVGERWNDPQLHGAVHLAARLQGVWERFRLFEIMPAGHELVRSQRHTIYNLRTTGGTLIRWGAAPNLGPPGESSFDEKLARLQSYIEEFGPLDSVSGPEEIDVRRTLAVKLNVAQEPLLPETPPR